MNLTITRIYKFAAAHQLFGMREGHKCGRLHGHNYTLEITLGLKPGIDFDVQDADKFQVPPGMVQDADVIDIIMRPILTKIDHHPLHDLPGERSQWEPMISQPTAENIARWFWNRLGLLSTEPRYWVTKLRVWENDHLFAEITR